MTRSRIFAYFEARAAALASDDPLHGLLVSYDQSVAMTKGFGLVIRNQEFELCCDKRTGALTEHQGKIEVVCYASVDAASKRDRQAAYEKAHAVAVWLMESLQADRTLGGAVFTASIPKLFTSPDAKDSHPYVTLEGFIEYPYELPA